MSPRDEEPLHRTADQRFNIRIFYKNMFTFYRNDDGDS